MPCFFRNFSFTYSFFRSLDSLFFVLPIAYVLMNWLLIPAPTG